MSGYSGQLELTSLPPRTQNCLSWSADGELAVAVNENVYILIPDRRQRNQEARFRTGEPWQRIKLAVDSFTEAEWPATKMQPSASFSIGEEQGAVGVVALAWSPPGLGERARCVLAVLTSNYIVSLWGPGSDPSLSTGWRRLLVVNHYSSSPWISIECMSWLPLFDTGTLNGEETTRNPARAPRDWIHCLSVVSKYGSHFIFRISPSKDQTLQAAQVGRVEPQLADNASNSTSGTTLPNGSLKAAIRHSSDKELRFRGSNWTKWAQSSQASSGALVSTQNAALGLIVTYRHGSDFTITINEPLRERTMTALRAIMPAIWDGPANIHQIKSPDAVSEDRLLLVSGHHLSLHFYKQASAHDANSHTSSVEELTGDSRLNERVQKLAEAYSKEHNFHGHVQVLVWGFSSWNNYVAACITLHTTRSLQYMIQSTSKLYLIFSHLSFEPGSFVKGKSTADAMQDFPMGVAPPSKDDIEAHSGAILWPHMLSVSHSVLHAHCNSQLVWANIISLFLRAITAEDKDTARKSIKQHQRQLSALKAAHSALAPLISNLSRPSTSAENVFTHIHSCTTAQHTRNIQPSNPSDKSASFVEYCAIAGCHTVVTWRSLYEGVCQNQHPHARCALTSLALVNPYVVKRCEDCGRRYLDEQALDLFYEDVRRSAPARLVPEERGTGDTQGQDDIGNTEGDRDGVQGSRGAGHADQEGQEEEDDGVAWMLRQAVLCIYCGGKFVRDLPLPLRHSGEATS